LAATIENLLVYALDQLACTREPAKFDFTDAFTRSGCDTSLAATLADYLPCACGRAFLRELGMKPLDTYRRELADGTLSNPMRFSDDPTWLEVERFVEHIRRHPEWRKRFSLAAQHSAEVDAMNRALNAGETLETLGGATQATVFLTRTP
jgi:hypothetical protein